LKKSRYFSDLIRNYIDEVDDLVTDSEGKPVLQKRLNEKRREIEAILPMIEFSPEMVSVVFYGAFGFDSHEIMRRIVQSEPGCADFLTWNELRRELTVAAWALPLIEAALKTQGGNDFLVATAALEFLRTKDTSDAPAAEPRAKPVRGDEDGEGERDEAGEDEDEADDLSEAGADWLSEQGFEPLDR
jgi:hypothetical protein